MVEFTEGRKARTWKKEEEIGNSWNDKARKEEEGQRQWERKQKQGNKKCILKSIGKKRELHGSRGALQWRRTECLAVEGKEFPATSKASEDGNQHC